MAESAIQIIIDVLANEGIDSLETFTKALASAYGNADTLSGSIDDLDASLTVLSQVTKSSSVMADAMLATLKDFGVVVDNDETFVTALSEALTNLGVSSKKAATGIKTAVDANEQLASSADTTAAALEREAGAEEKVSAQSVIMGRAVEGATARAAAGAVEAAAAIESMGTGYMKVATLAELGTPALMKAATWAGIGLAGLAYEGIKQYTQFQRLITQTITQAGEAPSKMGFLTNLAESVAKSTGQNLDDVANSIYRAASGTASWNNGLGATKKQLTDIVTQVSKLNVLGNISGGAESEQASRVITALINANIKGIGRNPSKASALVNAAVGSGDMRLGDLVPGIGRGVLQSAVANNVSAKDTFAWIADLTSTGTTASVAGNYVKTGINLLANPSAQGTDVLSMLGIQPGEMGKIMSSPGGLVAAAKTLKQAMLKLSPSSFAGYFFNTTGQVRAGGSGLQGAIDKLQTMSANSLSPKFIADWKAGHLTTAEKQQAFSLVLDKAYGGSKQFATIASILNNPTLLQNIESHMTAQDNPAYLKRSEARAEATPSQQFKRMEQSLLVDLVNIGHTLTPLALTFGHILTGAIDGLTKFKGVIYSFVTMAVGLLGLAAVSKGAELFKSISPYIGAGMNRMSLIAGKDSAFSRGLLARQNSSKNPFHFLNIYKSRAHVIASKIGGEAISAGMLPGEVGPIEGLSAGENVLNSTLNKDVAYNQQTARNTQIMADAMGNGGLGGGGGLRAAEREGGAAYAPQFRDPVTGKFLSYAESAPLAARMAEEESAAQTAAMYYGATGRGRGIKSFRTKMMGGAETAAENVESTYASRGEASLSSLDNSAASIAARGAAADASLVSSGLGELATSGVASTGIMSGLGETLGGLAGGPVGMMAMMAAPMLMGPLMQLGGKLGGLISDWFGGGKSKPYNPRINNPLDVTNAAAKAAAALKVLRTFETETKNKAGKEVWSVNQAARRANLPGYLAAVSKYDKIMGIYQGSIKNANATDLSALSYLYGPSGKNLSSLMKEVHRNEKRFAEANDRSLDGLMPAGEMRQLQDLSLKMPYQMQKTFWKRVIQNGSGTGALNADWSDAEKVIRAQKKWAKGVFTDASSESIQDLSKHSPAFAAMVKGGYFGIRGNLASNLSEMESTLGNKRFTVSEAAKNLPIYSQYIRQQIASDNTALATKNLPRAAKEAFKAQKEEADESLKKIDAMIREIREASKNTKLSGESVDKLARESATQLTNSGLPKAIAEALGPVIAHYMKMPKVTGTSSASTRTSINPVP